MGTLARGLTLGSFGAAAAWTAPAGLLTAAARIPAPVVHSPQATLGVPMQIVLLLTGLTLLPVLLMSLTPFLRITLVLHFLRQAIGTQATPSNPVLIGLALFLTGIIMQPTLQKSYEEGWAPYEQGLLTGDAALKKGVEPIRAFLVKYVREKDVQMLLDVSHTPAPAKAADLEFRILLPAYVLSELKTGFQIGAMLFLPFLIVDLLVASVTLSVGIVQLPPAMVSSPFKILLFVLVDGWNLVAGSLVKSFY
ncbi:MAG: flagellar type III secretion system pore protein FliP [Acidobacteria bacterium]|nr:flagellar type III secretion system pore protein FliP [Acidobacteriota bacterium]